jgi:hypothetical protein
LATVAAQITDAARNLNKNLQQSVALARLGQYLDILHAEAVGAGNHVESQPNARRRDGMCSIGGPPNSAIDVKCDEIDDIADLAFPATKPTIPRLAVNIPAASWEADMDEFEGELNEMPLHTPTIPPRSTSRMSPTMSRMSPTMSRMSPTTSRFSSTTSSHSSTRRPSTLDRNSNTSAAPSLSSHRTSGLSTSSSDYCTPVTTLEHSSPRSSTRTHSHRSSMFGHVLYSVWENPRAEPSPDARSTTSGGDTPEARQPSNLRGWRSSSKLSATFRNLGLTKRPSPTNPPPSPFVFGVPLPQSILLAKGVASTRHGGSSSTRTSKREYPLCILRCVHHIRSTAAGLSTPNLFATAPHPQHLAQLKDLFNSPASHYGKTLDWSATPFTVHDAAALILLFLAELPAPLISASVARRWTALSRQAIVDGGAPRLEQGMDFWEEAMVGISGQGSRAVFKLLLGLWGDVVDQVEKNGMTPERLAGWVVKGLMGEALVEKKERDCVAGMSFLIRRRSEYNSKVRGAGRGPE